MNTIADIINTITSTFSTEEKKAVYNALNQELYPNPRIKGINLYLATESGNAFKEALKAKAEENAAACGMAFITSGDIQEMLENSNSNRYALTLGSFDRNVWGTEEYVRDYGEKKGYVFRFSSSEGYIAAAPFSSTHYPNGCIAWAVSLTLLLAQMGVLKRLAFESDGLRCYAIR